MVDIEPVESEDKGVSIWVVLAVVVAVLLLLSVPLWFLVNNVVGTETTTTVPQVVVPTTTTRTTIPQAVVTTPTTTATSQSTISTTTPPPEDPNPFVGGWKATENEDRHLDLRVDAEGSFSYWDSASANCMFGGVRSPENWVGFFTFKAVGRQTIAATGTATCQFYGKGDQPGNSLASVFYYDPDTDMVESGLDGTLYSRSTSVPGIATDGSNPLVGSWEATDGDLTRVEMTILTDGSWESTDTRSAGCEGKGLTYATWSGEGSGTFSLTGIAFVEVSLTTFCHPVGKEKEVHSLDANFIFSYRRSTDTLVLGDDGPIYTRLP